MYEMSRLYVCRLTELFEQRMVIIGFDGFESGCESCVARLDCTTERIGHMRRWWGRCRIAHCISRSGVGPKNQTCAGLCTETSLNYFFQSKMSFHRYPC